MKPFHRKILFILSLVALCFTTILIIITELKEDTVPTLYIVATILSLTTLSEGIYLYKRKKSGVK